MFKPLYALLALSLCAPSLAADKTAATTSPSATTPATMPDKELFSQALDQLRDHKYQDAIATARRYQKTLSNKGRLTNVDWANSNHLIASAYISLGQFDKAKEPMEAVTKSGKSNRSVLLNQAIVDIANKSALVRTVKSLRPLAQSKPEDELVINLWGMAIDTTLANMDKPEIGTEIEDFVKANAALEKTRHMKHWGVDWLTDAQFAKIEKRRNNQQENVDVARRRYEEAVADYNSAVGTPQPAAAVGAFGGKTVTSAGSPYYPYYPYGTYTRTYNTDTPAPKATGASSAQINAAGARVASARTALDREVAKLPKPDWTVKLAPVPIEPLTDTPNP